MVKVTSLGPVRAKLIKKGMMYGPAHGELAFTVPLFDEFMISRFRGFRKSSTHSEMPVGACAENDITEH